MEAHAHMTPEELGLLAAVVAGSFVLSAFLEWRRGKRRADAALMGVLAVGMASVATVLYAS